MIREVSWLDLLELHVTKKLRHIVQRRFSSELGFASATGELQAGPPDAGPCAARAISAVAGRTGITRYVCPHHHRAELAAPVLIDGALYGCVFAAVSQEEDFLGELIELCVAEMVQFAGESTRRERPTKLETRYSYEGIIGSSKPIQDLFQLLDKVIDSDSTVLIQGENGTGKELVARAIHYNSPRARHRFVVQNCSAFNDNLLDSELFGHKKGAFTGAVADKQGLFEVADQGTFFLDEIGDMSPALQVKVLRVLQEGTFTPVGDTDSRQVDVRIIAATNRDLKQMVERGEFREDLYYRVNVINLTLPALRERRDDIPLLVDYFLKESAQGRRLKLKRLSKGCMDRLLEYGWPGNIRELENEIERLVVLSGDDKVIAEDLLSARIRQPSPASLPPSNTAGGGPLGDAGSLPDAVDALERNLIHDVLERHHWNKTRAAEELRISRRNLIRKVSKYKLESKS